MHIEGVVINSFDEFEDFLKKECPVTWAWYKEQLESVENKEDYVKFGHSGGDCECGCLNKTEEERMQECVDEEREEIKFDLLDKACEEMDPKPKSVKNYTAYQLFCMEEKPKILGELKDVATDLAKRWKALSVEDCAKYKKKADELVDQNINKVKLAHKDKVRIYTWPCCSELSFKKFVVGRNIVKNPQSFINKIFNEVVTVGNELETNPLTCEEKTMLSAYGPVQVVLMLDDCVSCT